MDTPPNYLTHYYLPGAVPFRSLSPLPDEEALPVMQALYAETAFAMRFRRPLEYLHARRETEAWVREQFIAKGGAPREPYPAYFVLGRSLWIERNVDGPFPCEVRVPLDVFADGDVSFTYPDSMISREFAIEQTAPYYQPEYHGHIFTRAEIMALVARNGLPEEGWTTNMQPHLGHYIEAQVWNFAPLAGFISTL